MIKLIILSVVALLFMMYVIYQMVRTGRVHRKGAKKLRKKLFPIFYGKKSLFTTKKNPEN